MELCRELGMTLSQLRNSMSEREIQLWAALRLVEQDERKKAELDAEVKASMAENKGKYTRGR